MATTRPRLRVLLLCDDNPVNANTMLDHINSFQKYSRHRINTFNPRGTMRPRALQLSEFDVVVVHWSLSLIYDHYVHATFRDSIAAFHGLKVHFLQDDYRWVDRMTAEQRRLGINVLFTLVSPEHFDKIWTARLPGVRFLSTLAGYVPQELLDRPTKAMSERDLDIVYRGREVPWWLGRLGQDKVLVGRGVKALSEQTGLKVDIAWTEEDRIYGERWVQFLSNSRTTIGCEGGASITDFDGSIEDAVLRYRRAHPDSTFDEVHAAILEPYEGNVPMNVMTPRLFEAAALRTALVLFPGRYSEVLEPWRHYIPLERDFSNFAEVVRLIKDDRFLTELTERTYREVAASPRHSLQSMVANFDRVLDEEGRRLTYRPAIAYQLVVGQRRAVKAVNRQRTAVLEAFARTFARTFAAFLEPVTRLRVIQYPGHYAARGYLALRATLRSRERVAFVAGSLFPRSGHTRPHLDVLLEDVFKIDVLCRAQRSQPSGPQQFQVWPHLHPDGVLELRSTRAGEIDPEVTATVDAVRAIENGGVTAVVWNHSTIADRVYQPTSRNRSVTVFLGANGRHDFASLRYLLKSDPGMAARIIRPTMPSSTQRRRQTRRLMPPGLRSQARRLIRDPLGYMTRVYVMTRLILPDRGFRRVVGRYLADSRLRSSTPVDAVLGDLLRLDLLRRACGISDGAEIRLQRTSSSWSYVTVPPGCVQPPEPENRSDDAAIKVTWDRSAVSDTFDVPVGLHTGMKVSFGPAGIWEFSALATIALYEPDLIQSILPAPTRVPGS